MPALACLFLVKLILTYNISKYLKGLTQETSLSSVATISGVGFYQIAFLTFCISGLIGNNFSLNTLIQISVIGIAIIPFYYFLEIIIRTVLSFYGLLGSQFSPQCPSIITVYKKTGLSHETKNVISYQFGDLFSNKNIFQTHFTRIVTVFIVAIILSTSIQKVPFGHTGYIELWGKPKQKAEPGYHLIYPWPISEIKIVNNEKIFRISSGEPNLNMPVIWKESHNEDEVFYLVQVGNNNNLPVEDYAINSVLRYKIHNVYDYLYKHKKPNEILHVILKRSLSHNLFTNTKKEIFAGHKKNIEDAVLKECKQQVSDYELGFEIISFSIIQIHPPKDTVEAFETTIAAKIEKEELELQATTYKKVHEARISSVKMAKISLAETEVAKIKNNYLGELNYFNSVLPIYELLGENFLLNKSLEQLPEALVNMKKIFVLSEHDKKVINLNLEQPLDPDILDLSLEASEK
jgi:modulator of FtsH protease HflK